MYIDHCSLGFQGLSRRQFFKTATIAAGSFCTDLSNTRYEAREKNSSKEAAFSPSSEAVRLFNGRDLTGLYTWLKDTKYEDPRRVFTVQDGLLRISGEVDGYLATQREYRDYHLLVEYKWGSKTYGA
jgi:hypothetical protein